MGTRPLRSRELVERLWNDVRARGAIEAQTALPDLQPHEQLTHSEPLRYINSNWQGKAPGATPGVGLKGRARERLARFVIHLLHDYLEAERQFNANVVRVANGLAAGHDRTAAEVRQLASGMKSESERLTDEFDTLHRMLEARVIALEEAAQRDS